MKAQVRMMAEIAKKVEKLLGDSAELAWVSEVVSVDDAMVFVVRLADNGAALYFEGFELFNGQVRVSEPLTEDDLEGMDFEGWRSEGRSVGPDGRLLGL
jgi:hypothetical protein